MAVTRPPVTHCLLALGAALLFSSCAKFNDLSVGHDPYRAESDVVKVRRPVPPEQRASRQVVVVDMSDPADADASDVGVESVVETMVESDAAVVDDAAAAGEGSAATMIDVEPSGGSRSDYSLPPEAKPGECYARVLVPPVYTTRTERVLVREASTRVEVVPAKFEWAEERVLVEEASERIEVVPAVYKWVEDKVLITPASYRIEEVPAEYEWVVENVLVTPAHTVWKKGRGLVEKVDNSTGEIMCLVEVPAVYDTVQKQVLVREAATRKIEIAAEYEIVRKKVLVKPATTRRALIPAKYETIKVKKTVAPQKEWRVPVPAEYADVAKRVVVVEGRSGWERVLCETNMSEEMIRRIQVALAEAGHDPGDIDGIIGPQTLAAVRSYQAAESLAVGGLTFETLTSLGIEVKSQRN